MKVQLHAIKGPLAGEVRGFGDKRELTIGRAQDVDISIPDTALSRAHARLELVGARLVVRDLGSKHGVFVNGRREQESELRDRDLLRALALVEPHHHRALDILAPVNPASARGSAL